MPKRSTRAAGSLLATLGAAILLAQPASPWARPASPPSRITLGVPVYHQQHTLSCEESALSMVMAYRGRRVTEQEVFNFVGIDWTHHWAGRGGGDPYRVFVGNPDGSELANTGYGVYHPPIRNAGTHFGGPVARAGEGIAPAMVYDAVRGGHPVIVWITYDWRTPDRHDYLAYDGRRIPYAGPDEHTMVVSGVTADRVRVNDPDRGQYWVSKARFEAAYQVYGRMAVVFR